MPRLADEDLARWKREINPAPILSKRIQIERRLADWWAVCPFHPDHNPSFEMSKDADGAWFYHCYGCGASGNIFQFVQQFDKIKFRDAVKVVLSEAGIAGWADGEEQADPEIEAAEQKEFKSWPLAQYAAAETALEKSPEAQEWLAKRGIGMPVARRFHLGFLPTAARLTDKHPWATNGWVALPTLSVDGQTVTAIKYRSLVGKKEGKVSGILREPDTSTTLYNLQAVKPGEDVWIVEGEPDTLALAQAGMIAVGYPTASYVPTEEECELLSSAKRRFLAGDNDAPGMKATEALMLRLHGETFRIKWPHNRKDANDVLTNECGNDSEKFRMLLETLRARTVRGIEADIIEYHSAPRPDASGDYVVAPVDGQLDGWFPLGDISLVGGASGTGKTTLMFELLHKQKNGWPVLGHKTFKLPFHVFGYDRRENAFMRTLQRMNLQRADVPTTPMELAFGTQAVQAIVDQIEKLDPMPKVVYLEGLDMLLDDTNKKSTVAPFMRQLQEVAAHFHIALIGSLGAPKTKRGEDYAAKRDHLSGSEAWGRNCETVAILEFTDDDDGTAPQRALTVLPRNAKAEKFTLEFESGKLVPRLAVAEPEKASAGRPSESTMDATRFLSEVLQGAPAPVKQVLEEGHVLHNISRSTMYRAVDELHVRSVKIGGVFNWELPELHAGAPEPADSAEVESAESDFDFGHERK